MKRTIDIFCKLSEKIWVGLGNVRENYGHDDSLPYQADIFIHDADNCPAGDTSFKRIATIWNDGWGGDSNIEPLSAPRTKEDIQTLENECHMHVMWWNGKPTDGKFNLATICDDMAVLYIDNPQLLKEGTLIYLLDDDPKSQGGRCSLDIIK